MSAEASFDLTTRSSQILTNGVEGDTNRKRELAKGTLAPLGHDTFENEAKFLGQAFETALDRGAQGGVGHPNI
jgi:hypothetical protein